MIGAGVGLTLTSTASQWTGGTIAGSVTNNGSITLGPGPAETLSGTRANAGTITDPIGDKRVIQGSSYGYLE